MIDRYRPAFLRWTLVSVAFIGVWQGIVTLSGTPPYILPPPWLVAVTWVANSAILFDHFLVTLTEIVLGLVLGAMLGIASAVLIGQFRSARRWLLPVLVASQAIPVFALAPVLVLWLGYGMMSKVAMATLIIFFPVSAAFLDGLRRTERGWLDLAHTMTELPGNASTSWGARRRWSVLVHVQIPGASPALASGLRVATAIAPIGAIVGEWVGSSAGLGYLMLHANARMQVDLMFAALVTLAVFSVLLWFAVDAALRRAIPWQSDSFNHPEGRPT